jgi:PAS domain S-box-containing protein
VHNELILDGLAFVAFVAMAVFPLKVLRRSYVRGAHREHHLLEQLISQFSASLLSTETDQLDATIEKWMRRVLELVGANRICWYVYRSGSVALECIYSVSTPGFPRSPLLINAEDIPYTFARLTDEDAALHIPAELPPDASRDCEFYAKSLIGSVVLIPSNCGTDQRGVLGIAAIASEKRWADEILNLLRVLNNLIVTAIQRRTFDQLRWQSEQRFQCLFREAPIGLALEDLEGNLLFANPALCSILGYTEQELQGMRCAQVSHPADQGNEELLFQKLLDGSTERYRCEKRFVRKDGTQIWGRVDVSLLKSQAAGQPLVVGMLEDITAENRATQELLRTHLELQYVTQRLIQVQEEERQRISRELHDDVGQRISLLAIELELLSGSLAGSGREAEGRQTAELQSQANGIARDVQQLSHELHSAKLHHLGLVAALRELCRQASKRIQVTTDIEAGDSIICSCPMWSYVFSASHKKL